MKDVNRGYFFGGSSSKNISTTHKIMQMICHRALEVANTRQAYCPDFGVSRGYSTAGEQFNLYLKGRLLVGDEYQIVRKSKVVTHCDGYNIESKHQSKMAVDIFALDVNGKYCDDIRELALIATCFYEAVKYVIEQTGENIYLTWGGNFKSILDGLHIEIEII